MASMDTRPRFQSVTTIPTRQSNQSRSSKVFQRVSNIKAHFRFPGRKANDERRMNPYPTQTEYGEPAIKPYMSHPALNMVVQPLNHRYNRSEGSPANRSPSRSPSRNDNIEIVELSPPTQPSPQTLPRRSIPAALISGMRTGVSPSARGTDQMTYNSRSRSQQLLGNRRPSTSSGALENPGKSASTPEIVISDSLELVAQRVYLGRPSTSCGAQGPNGYNETKDTSSSLGIVPTHNHSHARLKSLPNLPNPHPSTNSSDSPTPYIASPPILPVKATTNTSSSTLSVPQVQHNKSLPPTPPSSRSYAIMSTSQLQGPPTAQPIHPHEATPSPNPTLRNSARSLSIPAINRLSLTMPDGYSARFSPSIITRTPPLPIMNLPPLPPILSESSSSTRHGRVGLKNMPELPHTRTAGDHRDDDDDDDEGEVDHDDDEEREDDDNDTETLRDGASSLYHDNDSQDESSHPVQIDAGVGLKPSLTSVRKNPWSSSHAPNEYSGLPEVNRSRVDIDFSFLDRPVNSSSTSLKGKGKTPLHGPNSERTPTSSSMQYDYFSQRGVQKQWEREDWAQSEQAQPQAEGSRHIRQGASSTLTRTPRGGNTPVRMVFSPPAPSVASVSSSPMLSGQDSLSPSPPILPRNHDARRMSIRPGMYTHTSVSLIDIHAAEKKEMVEEIVRDAEEEAVVEETERRRRSVRISMKAKGKCKESDVPPSVLEAPPLTPSSPIQVGGIEGEDAKRTTKAPAYETGPHRLRRRRSMPSFVANSNPPPYPAFERIPHGLPTQLLIQPRDDEGRERLPAYSNDVYLKSIVPLKMEFVAAGVQAKDRKWRRVVCVLEGTALKIYRCPANVAGVSVLGGWWERKVGVGDVSSGSTTNTTGATGSASAAARVRTQQEAAVPKGGNPLGQTELHVPSPTSAPLPRPRPQVQPPPPTSSSRSRLGLANLLKPGRTHTRSTSDMRTPARPRSPRASLNIPAGTSASNLSSRSHSPVTPFSGSTLSLSSHNSTSHSMPTTSSSSHFRSGQRGDSIDGSMVGVMPDPDPKPTDLIRAYTMQHAESGLGNDYVKRKNVIRVRVEGEQFLFQAKDVADVVAWIEGLQASANIALDLDERPMPKGPLFPRRRRRRGARRPGADTDTVGPSDAPVNLPLNR